MAPVVKSHMPPAATAYMQGKLTAQPRELGTVSASPQKTSPFGLQPLGVHQSRDGLLYVPKSYAEPNKRPAPLFVMMHGAGGNAKGGMSYMLEVAEEAGAIIMSPQSRGSTWDGIRDGFGKDVALIDAGLLQIFQQYDIDRQRVAVGGFSDGASYALSLGLTNGQLFSHIIAFSPGFMSPGTREGKPAVFITHGRDDRVLPIDRCSRQLVPKLQHLQYEITYLEFEGPHVVQPSSARDAMQWFLQDDLQRLGIPMTKIGNAIVADVNINKGQTV